MANTNTMTAILDRILAGAMPVLRESAFMPQLVNGDFSLLTGARGSTIEVSFAGSAAVQDVTPSNVPPDITGTTPSVKIMTLDKWKESGFFVTDKEAKDIREGVLPQQAQACIRAIANQVNTDVFLAYKDFFGFAGVAGTTPFSTNLQESSDALKILHKQVGPRNNLRGVIDADAEGNARLLDALASAEKRGSDETVRSGMIGRFHGIDWYTDHAVPTHTTTGAGTVLVNQANHAIGDKTVTWDGGGTAPAYGDVFTVAGDSQTYAVVSSTATVITYEPGAKTAFADNAAITFKASHVANLIFDPMAIGFANRAFSGGELLPEANLAVPARTMQDPVSKLVLRIEATREHRRLKLNFDMLYGMKTFRPEYGTRMAG